MKKLRKDVRHLAPTYKLQWLLIIMVIAGLFWVQDYFGDKRRRRLPEERPRVTSDYFVALVFPKIGRSEGPRSMSAKNFHECMKVLRSNGFTPVTLKEIRAFYYEGKDLPERPVLISFIGHSETYDYAGRALADLNLHAALFLDADAMASKNYTYINWHDAKGARKDEHWDVSLLIRTNEKAAADRARFIRKLGAPQPEAICYSPKVELDNIDNPTPLSFIHRASDGFNDRSTNPTQLNLLVIPSYWNGANLNYFLSRTMTVRTSLTDDFEGPEPALDWLATWGTATTRRGHLILRSRPREAGAEAWLLGTHRWEDAVIEVDYRLILGEHFWIYLRSKDRENYVRFGQAGDKFFLQHRIQGGPVRGYSSKPMEIDRGKFTRLRVVIRGQNAYAYVNGRRIFRQPLRFDASLARGKAGLSVWHSILGGAYVQVTRVDARRLRDLWLQCPNEQECMAAMEKFPEAVSVLSPEWLTARGGKILADLWGLERLKMHSGYYNMTLIPTLIIPGGLDSMDVPELAGRLERVVREYGFRGIHLDLRSLSRLEDVERIGRLVTDLNQRRDFKLYLSASWQQVFYAPGVLESADRVSVRADRVNPALLIQMTGADPAKYYMALDRMDPEDIVKDYPARFLRTESPVFFAPSAKLDTVQFPSVQLCPER